jgi:hypothetical protein
MATDIQVGGVSIQAEMEANQPCIAGIGLQVETGIPDIQVADVSLQVEILESTAAINYKVYPGQYVKIYVDDTLQFGGIISNTSSSLKDESGGNIEQEVQCTGYNGIPSRRTIAINNAAGDLYGTDIADDMVDNYLYQDGVEKGTIDAGSELENDWTDDCLNIADILDACGSRSGYQWFIDKNMDLYFYQDPAVIPAAAHSIDTSTDTWTDFRNVVVDDDIQNYVNKQFVVGGDDGTGNLIVAINGSLTEQNRIQDYAAGAGVYGNVIHDSGVDEYEIYNAGAGTDTNTIAIGSHPFATGDYFYNITRDLNSFITDGTSDPDEAECEVVTGQTNGDEILLSRQANDIAKNELKKSPYVPQTIEFDTFEIDFEPQTKMSVLMPELEIDTTSYFNITEVDMSHYSDSQTADQGYFITHVKAILRDNADFSTQKSADYTDYFRGV